MEAFDVFVKSYENGSPYITLTVSPKTTIAKFKKDFASQCNLPFINQNSKQNKNKPQ